MKKVRLPVSLWLSLFFILFNACIPEPTQRPLTLSNYTSVPAETVKIEIVDDLFPSSGPLALVEGEREYLQYQMYERYNQGFYEPAIQPLISQDMQSVFTSAFEEDGTTIASLNADFQHEVERVLPTAPDEILWNIRYTVANSAVMSEEMLRETGFWSGAISKEDFEENKKFMLNVYETVSLEIARRQTP